MFRLASTPARCAGAPRLSRQDGDASAIAHAQSGSNVRVVDKLDSLRLEERGQAVDVLAGVSRDLVDFRQVNTVGLRHVEDVGIAESEQGAGVLLGNVLLGFFVFLAANAEDGSEDANALSSGVHAATEVLPRPEPGDAGSRRHLPCNL
jgi:hypothetical protein